MTYECKLINLIIFLRKMNKTIYISGSITDLSTGQPRQGWQQEFNVAEVKLRQMGFNVINPVQIAEDLEQKWHEEWSCDEAPLNGPIRNAILEQGPTRGHYLAACLQRMNDEAFAHSLHGVYIVGNARDALMSHGVRMEVLMAEVLGLPILSDSDLEKIQFANLISEI